MYLDFQRCWRHAIVSRVSVISIVTEGIAVVIVVEIVSLVSGVVSADEGR